MPTTATPCEPVRYGCEKHPTIVVTDAEARFVAAIDPKSLDTLAVGYFTATTVEQVELLDGCAALGIFRA